jgi:hypothetical protein
MPPRSLGAEPAADEELGDGSRTWAIRHCLAITATTKQSIARPRLDGAAGIIILLHGSSQECRSWLYGNALHDNAMRRRFHSIPCAPPSRSCTNISRNKFCRRLVSARRTARAADNSDSRRRRRAANTRDLFAAHSSLSNGTCSVTVTIRRRIPAVAGLDVTRWRDATFATCRARFITSGI